MRLFRGSGGEPSRPQARVDRARVPAARGVRGARPTVHLAGRLATGPGRAVHRPHLARRLPGRRQTREVGRLQIYNFPKKGIVLYQDL